MIRPMTFKEVQNHQWKTYKLDITNKTSKYDVINFVNSKAIKTDELAFGQYPVYIQPMTTEVILIKKDGSKEFTNYEHIYKGNRLYFNVDGKMLPWNRAKNKIKSIIFMDDLWLHKTARRYWNENGFDAVKFLKDGVRDSIITELLAMF